MKNERLHRKKVPTGKKNERSKKKRGKVLGISNQGQSGRKAKGSKK